MAMKKSKSKAKAGNKAAASPYPTVTESDRDWRAEDDMRTLARAEEIKADKKRFAAAQVSARRKIEEMEAIFGEDDESDDKK